MLPLRHPQVGWWPVNGPRRPSPRLAVASSPNATAAAATDDTRQRRRRRCARSVAAVVAAAAAPNAQTTCPVCSGSGREPCQDCGGAGVLGRGGYVRKNPLPKRLIGSKWTAAGRENVGGWRHFVVDQVSERRVRESMRVEERVLDVADASAWRATLEAAGDRLVVLEVEAEGVCQTGLEEEADLQWELDKKAALRPCLGIKSTLQRTARECPDVVLASLSADTDEGSDLCAELGVEVLPTIQFWRRGKLLWEHKGVLALEQDLGEGVLYFGGAQGAGGRLDPGGVVAELSSRADLDAFVAGPAPAEQAEVAAAVAGKAAAGEAAAGAGEGGIHTISTDTHTHTLNTRYRYTLHPYFV